MNLPPFRRTALPLAGVAQLVEHQPSKLRVAGSNPVARFVARVAQLVERILGKDEVRGSIPRASLVVRRYVGNDGTTERKEQDHSSRFPRSH
jgi:hypothetical protein